MKLSKVYKQFLLIVLIYLLIGIAGLIPEKGFFVLWLNKLHNPITDQFFRFYTYLGDGLALALVAILLIIFDRKRLPEFAISAILIGLIVQVIMKGWLFEDVVRPFYHFKRLDIDIHFVENSPIAKNFSFPSGHTTTGFAIASSLMLFYRKKKWLLPLFIYAFVVGISRMYLAQHFFIDTWFGTLIGTLIPLISYAIVRLFKKKKQ
jgi:membrane-associated phospholipid phosphatase